MIKTDAEGNPVGDANGYIWGGLEDGKTTDLEFDLTGDTVTFDFTADPALGCYGYYAVVTTDPVITVKNSKGEEVALDEEGLYDLPNKHVKAEGTKAEIKVSKILKGRGWQQGDSFTFELTADDETFPLPADCEVTVEDEKEASFGEINYDAEGIYTYTIREKKGSLDGVTYDDEDHKVVVRVEDKDLDLKLDSEVIYKDSESDTSATITNTYKEEEHEEHHDNNKKKDQEKHEEKDLDVGTAKKDVRTGDETDLSVWLLLSAVSAAALCTVVAIRKKSKES